MSKVRQTPWLLLLIGGGFLALMTWSLLLAGQRVSAVVDRDYYSHGLRYNQTELERRAAAALGWTTTITLQGDRLQVRLQDRDRQPVSRAGGQLTLFGSSRSPAVELPLQEIGAGTYQAQLPAGLHGDQPAAIAFDRDGVRFNRRLLLSRP